MLNELFREVKTQNTPGLYLYFSFDVESLVFFAKIVTATIFIAFKKNDNQC